MKNVLIIAYYYKPQNNGGVQRIVNLKKYLPEFGYNVYVLTTDIEGRCDGETNVLRFTDKGNEYSHQRTAIVSYPFKILRELLVYFGIVGDWFYWWKKEVIRNFEDQVKDINFDYIISSFPPIMDLEIGEYLSDKYNIPLIVDYRDGLMHLPFRYINEKSYFFQKRTIELERRVSEKSKLNIVVNDSMEKYYKERYSTKVLKIENGFDTEELFDENVKFELPKGFNIVYTGALARSRGAVELSSVLKIINDNTDVNFVFIGEYTLGEINTLSKIENVHVYPKQRRDVIIPIQRSADILLLCSGDIEGGTSGKLYEYIFSGTPILNLGRRNSASEIISKTMTGKTFLEGDIKEIKEFISQVREGHYKISPKDLEDYTRKNQIRKLALALDEVEMESNKK